MEVVGKRDLAFFPGSCSGPTFAGFHYASETGSKAVSLSLNGSNPRTIDNLYYNGGGHFTLPSSSTPGVEVLASYADTNQIAAVSTINGKGRTVLCSVHFEYPLHDPPSRDAIKKQTDPPSSDDIDQSEKERVEWAEEILLLLGLRPPRRSPSDQTHSVIGDEDPGLLLHPTHPSPIFVLPHPSLPQLGSASFEPPALKAKLVSEGNEQVLRDGNDELHIAPVNAIAEAGGSAGVAAYLASKRRSKPIFPPPVEALSIEPSANTPEPPLPPDLSSLPKYVLTPSDTVKYTPRWTPLFNFDMYWRELDESRKRAGKKSGVFVAGKQALGDLVWYAETITSTQTILDRNPLLLTSLPAPIVCMASFQLSGRGRGSNVWLSPPGCLQFSTLLTLPAALSSKIVFIQYLTALAVAEAVDEDGRLGVKIKWPNDIYSEVEGVGGTEVGSGVKGKAKIGGILVNTNYVGGQWRIVIGCGINVLNALPTTSLSQLHSLLSARTPTPTKPLPSPPTMENTFANIMNVFEQKWEQFVDEKGFSGFLDEYYGRWLHTKQEVTLTTVEPHQRLRIHSITADHGLLRCVPLSTTKSTSGLTPLYTRGDHGDDDRVLAKKSEQYVDLQPDGNSFDLMSGMIKRKV